MASGVTLTRRGVLCTPAILLLACNQQPNVIEFSGTTMGTTYNVVAVDHSSTASAIEAHAEVETSLRAVNGSMSNWDPSSEISLINAAQTTEAIPVSADLAEVLAAARSINAASDGRFDVTVGPLIEAWGFGAGDTSPHMLTDAEIKAAMADVGQSQMLTVTQNTVRKARPGVEIYLAAIAKGFGVDQCAAALHALGYRDYMVEIGGDLFTAGKNPDGIDWRIGVEQPTPGLGGVAEVVQVSGKGMATSGDYRNFFEDEGRRFSHIIDPATGRPITHRTVSATVFADSAMLADGWATAMLVLGAERGTVVAEEQGLAVMFIERTESDNEHKFRTSGTSALAELQV